MMSKTDTDIRQLLYASITPSTSPLYNNLKAELISLGDYLADVGAISLHTGRRKVEDEGDVPEMETPNEPSTTTATAEKSLAKTFVVTATPDPTLDNLPWPEPEEYTTVPEAAPITAVRTGADLQGARKIQPKTTKTSLNILSTTLTTQDSLAIFLLKFCLGLKMRAAILGDGNCWWSTNCDLIRFA